MSEAKDVAVSVDTYRAEVAREAIEAGAHIVNDVSAGLMDPDMLKTVAQLGCTVCLMHMRGTPETMNSLTTYPDGVVETVGRELLERVREAEAAGIRRWRIILDPGIGFAKTQEQNLELLRRLRELRSTPGLHGLPWLVGVSRKAFVGRITGVKEASQRAWGTAAAVTAAIQGGADIIRVHDVEEMAQVSKMADALFRI
jgi:2-amino-4-hydroxy-6-hydroxymethyldihydropteridine diphosphokinase/dihydropteroate synthase